MTTLKQIIDLFSFIFEGDGLLMRGGVNLEGPPS